jgi:hypothetical protein
MASNDDITQQCEMYRDILLATLAYENKRAPCPPDSPHYAFSLELEDLQVKNIGEKYLQYRPKELQRRLRGYTNLYMQLGDVNYDQYIKEKTGFDINIFEGIEDRINKIIEVGRIITIKERRDVIAKIQLTRNTGIDQDKTPNLRNILNAYRINRAKTSTTSAAFYLKENNSPDNKYCLVVYEMFGSTMVQFETKGFTSAVYQATGVNLNIHCYWSGSEIINVETKKDYHSVFKAKEIHGLPQISIEYLHS